jgi:GntP family gluconate:H+ symporter
MAPIAAASSGVHIELLVLAMGAGSLIFSHVNDAGFWLVRVFQHDCDRNLQTWTVMETIISIVALLGILLLDVILQ